jgi:hypothetical protein
MRSSGTRIGFCSTIEPGYLGFIKNEFYLLLIGKLIDILESPKFVGDFKIKELEKSIPAIFK